MSSLQNACNAEWGRLFPIRDRRKERVSEPSPDTIVLRQSEGEFTDQFANYDLHFEQPCALIRKEQPFELELTQNAIFNWLRLRVSSTIIGYCRNSYPRQVWGPPKKLRLWVYRSDAGMGYEHEGHRQIRVRTDGVSSICRPFKPPSGVEFVCVYSPKGLQSAASTSAEPRSLGGAKEGRGPLIRGNCHHHKLSLLERYLGDPLPGVRYETLRQWEHRVLQGNAVRKRLGGVEPERFLCGWTFSSDEFAEIEGWASHLDQSIEQRHVVVQIGRASCRERVLMPV